MLCVFFSWLVRKSSIFYAFWYLSFLFEEMCIEVLHRPFSMGLLVFVIFFKPVSCKSFLHMYEIIFLSGMDLRFPLSISWIFTLSVIFCCAAAWQVDVRPFVYPFLWPLCFSCHMYEIISKTRVVNLCSYASFSEFHCFTSCIVSLVHSQFNSSVI